MLERVPGRKNGMVCFCLKQAMVKIGAGKRHWRWGCSGDCMGAEREEAEKGACGTLCLCLEFCASS